MSERRFIVGDERIRHCATQAVAHLPLSPVHEVVIRLFKPKRKLAQNAFYWAVLQDVSEQAWIDYKRFSADVLHEYCKREFLPAECTKGVSKWDFLPDGSRVLLMSTTDLNRLEFADYLTQVLVWAGDLGVVVSHA